MKLPAEVDGALWELRDAVQHMVEDLSPRPKGDTAQAELGFAIEQVDLDVVRGNYDVTRLQARNPKLVGAITSLLGMHFFKWDVIATICGVSWETVAAVAEHRKESIREFKGRMAGRLMFLIEAMTPVLMDKIRRGQVTALDLKLVYEVFALMSGEATSIVETRATTPALDALKSGMAEILEKYGAAGMGLGEGKILAEGAGGMAGGVSPGAGMPALGDGAGRLDLVPVREVEVVELGVSEDDTPVARNYGVVVDGHQNVPSTSGGSVDA
jgi:hypothetical protein